MSQIKSKLMQNILFKRITQTPRSEHEANVWGDQHGEEAMQRVSRDVLP